MRREQLLDRLRSTPRWDVLVIGGGATGLGCAVDAAARGYSTLLLEAHDSPRPGPPGVTDPAGGDEQPPAGRLRVVRFRVALEPRHEAIGSALLQPGEAGVVVDLGHRPGGVPGDPGGVELDRPPGVDEPPVGVVDRFDAATLECRSGEEDCGRSGERLDVSGRISQLAPDDRSGAALAPEVREGCDQLGPTHRPAALTHGWSPRWWWASWRSRGCGRCTSPQCRRAPSQTGEARRPYPRPTRRPSGGAPRRRWCR